MGKSRFLGVDHPHPLGRSSSSICWYCFRCRTYAMSLSLFYFCFLPVLISSWRLRICILVRLLYFWTIRPKFVCFFVLNDKVIIFVPLSNIYFLYWTFQQRRRDAGGSFLSSVGAAGRRVYFTTLTPIHCEPVNLITRI